jgi:hypothetical protein
MTTACTDREASLHESIGSLKRPRGLDYRVVLGHNAASSHWSGPQQLISEQEIIDHIETLLLFTILRTLAIALALRDD